MALKQLVVLTREQSKTSIAQAWADKMPFAHYFPSDNRYRSPRGLKGTFIIDDLTYQCAEVIQFVCTYINIYNFYITCNSTELWKLPSDLKHVFMEDYPEFFI